MLRADSKPCTEIPTELRHPKKIDRNVMPHHCQTMGNCAYCRGSSSISFVSLPQSAAWKAAHSKPVTKQPCNPSTPVQERRNGGNKESRNRFCKNKDPQAQRRAKSLDRSHQESVSVKMTTSVYATLPRKTTGHCDFVPAPIAPPRKARSGSVGVRSSRMKRDTSTSTSDLPKTLRGRSKQVSPASYQNGIGSNCTDSKKPMVTKEDPATVSPQEPFLVENNSDKRNESMAGSHLARDECASLGTCTTADTKMSSCSKPKTLETIRTRLTVPSNLFLMADSREGSVCTPTTPRSLSSSPCPFEPDSRDRSPLSFRTTRRPLRGPYGEMLEAEMSKSDLSKLYTKAAENVRTRQNSLPLGFSYFGEESGGGRRRTSASSEKKKSSSSGDVLKPPPRRKISANIPLILTEDDFELTAKVDRFLSNRRISDQVEQSENPTSEEEEADGASPISSPLVGTSNAEFSHREVQRTKSESTGSFNRSSVKQRHRDTRTHVVGELYETERSYVESLQLLVTKYLHSLKNPDCAAAMVEPALVDDIFYQIPEILSHHEAFLEELKTRLESWDSFQCIGDVFLNAITQPDVIDTYIGFVNHWTVAKEALKTAQTKPQFTKFLNLMSREHKGKLSLDALLIMPVQRVPRYELLIKMLLKHTARDHRDFGYLVEAQKEVHNLALKINCVENEASSETRHITLRDLENLIDGLSVGELNTPDRTLIRQDSVTMAPLIGSSPTHKERVVFLLSDLLLVASIKKRATTMRKSSLLSTLEPSKYKLLTKIPLEDVGISKSRDEVLNGRPFRDIDFIDEDLGTLSKISDLASSLHTPHSNLVEAIKDLYSVLQRQLSDRQILNDAQQSNVVDITLSNQENGIEEMSLTFSNSEKRSSWEESFLEAKQKLQAAVKDRSPVTEFLSLLPVRKTRAGLQFTCASAANFSSAGSDSDARSVWICNSDGYVGQVCIVSVDPEPAVVSCNGVCNARITCITPVPCSPVSRARYDESPQLPFAKIIHETDNFIESESSRSSSDEDEVNHRNKFARSDPADAEKDRLVRTMMWLGTEDGCVHIFNCADNIRPKKNRICLQHRAAVISIVFADEQVFVSLVNGCVIVYHQNPQGGWNLSDPHSILLGSVSYPVTQMLPVPDKLWCSTRNVIKILETTSLTVEEEFVAGVDAQKAVVCMEKAGLGVWISSQSSAVIRLFHLLSHECLCEVNLAPAVLRTLSGCDDIIRQHKAACLRVTTLLRSNDTLWIGTSAGVVLTLQTPALGEEPARNINPPTVTCLPHGHTGHVRFLTAVGSSSSTAAGISDGKSLVISGGDGYENFREPGSVDTTGREDSTNHLLFWLV